MVHVRVHGNQHDVERFIEFVRSYALVYDKNPEWTLAIPSLLDHGILTMPRKQLTYEFMNQIRRIRPRDIPQDHSKIEEVSELEVSELKARLAAVTLQK